MMRFIQPDRTASARPRSTWLRAMAALCLVLVCVASTAQVCHTHPDLLPLQKDSRQNSPGPDHCPLCVAMQSALPVEAHHGAEPVLQMQPVFPSAVLVQRVRLWSFDLFSRPPPALSSRA